MKKREERKTLRKVIATLTMLASVCTMLLTCMAVLYVFFHFFYDKTEEEIEYVLANTSQRFQSHMQFIGDGAVDIRHNAMLDDFFQGGNYNRTEAETQLSYSMELFSDRNMIERQIPFVTSVYLFNNEDDCIAGRYYATTVALENMQDDQYAKMQQQFKLGTLQYQCTVNAESVNLYFRIYDDVMKEKGVCIVEINMAAIERILQGITAYSKGSWIIMSEGDEVASYGEEQNIIKLKTVGHAWRGRISLEGLRVIGYADTCGFGIRSILAVGQENIFSILKPIFLIFIIGLVLVLVVTVMVVYAISYWFTRPVSRMIESIRSFGGQALDMRMEDSNIQEFHDISVVFNEMADGMEHLIRQVYEKQILATQSQVKYLQAQINPHFQFNILAMLAIKAKLAGNEEVYEGLQAFSKLVQGKIFREREIKIKVSEELEIVRFYLYLQSSRFKDKIFYEIILEDEGINRNLIPRLLIEPIVENAVSHGLEPKHGKGTIRVTLYERVRSDMNAGLMLHICVEDDGVGFDAEQLFKDIKEEKVWSEKVEHTHTGLKNTKRLLKILYGEQHEMKISVGRRQGTKIEIILPVERGE